MMSSRGEEVYKVYVVQSSAKVISRCVLITTDPGDLVLDPTCGSGTTAAVAEEWGRRWITIDTSRVALALARTRLMSAKYPYYLLADSREGRGKEQEVSGHSFVATRQPWPITGYRRCPASAGRTGSADTSYAAARRRPHRMDTVAWIGSRPR
jgi:SAM-dependent methyltransferase